MYVSLTAISGNTKVGPIPVSTTEAKSCPSSCPLMSPQGAGNGKGGECYAAFGPVGMHWRKVGASRGTNWTLFCNAIKRLMRGQLWRHNQAGDLPKSDIHSDDDVDRIDPEKTSQLSEASQHTRGWTYTHYDVTDEHNAAVVSQMNNRGGMTVNLSADSLDQADEYYDLDIGPVTVILPENAPRNGNKTPQGRTIVPCPAQTHEGMTCQRCQLCERVNRKSVVGFFAHGTAKKRLSAKLNRET